jgi:recombination protein RecR
MMIRSQGPQSPEIERLVTLLARLPGLGPRSARRAALAMLKRRDSLMLPLSEALAETARAVRTCSLCGNLDSADPCFVCSDPRRDARQLCVVAEVADLWALERAGMFRGRYHVLGGVLSALDGVGSDDLRLSTLVDRVRSEGVEEVILALAATVDGQTTAHVVTDLLAPAGVMVTRLAQGVPMGGELEYLDEGTLMAALASRRAW